MKKIKTIGVLIFLFMALTCNYCLADEIVVPKDTEKPTTTSTMKEPPPATGHTSSGVMKDYELEANYILLGIAIIAVVTTIIVLVAKKPKEDVNEEKNELSEENKNSKGE